MVTAGGGLVRSARTSSTVIGHKPNASFISAATTPYTSAVWSTVAGSRVNPSGSRAGATGDDPPSVPRRHLDVQEALTRRATARALRSRQNRPEQNRWDRGARATQARSMSQIRTRTPRRQHRRPADRPAPAPAHRGPRPGGRRPDRQPPLRPAAAAVRGGPAPRHQPLHQLARRLGLRRPGHLRHDAADPQRRQHAGHGAGGEHGPVPAVGRYAGQAVRPAARAGPDAPGLGRHRRHRRRHRDPGREPRAHQERDAAA